MSYIYETVKFFTKEIYWGEIFSDRGSICLRLDTTPNRKFVNSPSFTQRFLHSMELVSPSNYLDNFMRPFGFSFITIHLTYLFNLPSIDLGPSSVEAALPLSYKPFFG